MLAGKNKPNGSRSVWKEFKEVVWKTVLLNEGVQYDDHCVLYDSFTRHVVWYNLQKFTVKITIILTNSNSYRYMANYKSWLQWG